MEGSGHRFEHFFGSGLISANKQKLNFFLADFTLQNKVETTLLDGLETSGRKAYR